MSKKLNKCKCGKVPKKLVMTPYDKNRPDWAYVSGGCCDYRIKMRTACLPLDEPDLLEIATYIWNHKVGE